jgi:hypothetical protein
MTKPNVPVRGFCRDGKIGLHNLKTITLGYPSGELISSYAQLDFSIKIPMGS